MTSLRAVKSTWSHLARRDADDALAVEAEQAHGRVRGDRQVRPPRTGQRKAFAVLMHAVLDRRRRVADLLLVLGVEVVDEVPPGLVSGRQEELHGLVVDLLRDADADGTAEPRTGEPPSEWSSMARNAGKPLYDHSRLSVAAAKAS